MGWELWSVGEPAHLSDYRPPPPAPPEAASACTRVLLCRRRSSSSASAAVRGLAAFLGRCEESSCALGPDSSSHGSLSLWLFTQPSGSPPGPPPSHPPVPAGLAPSPPARDQPSSCFLSQLQRSTRPRAAPAARPPPSEHSPLARPPARRLRAATRGSTTQDRFSKPVWRQCPDQ